MWTLEKMWFLKSVNWGKFSSEMRHFQTLYVDL